MTDRGGYLGSESADANAITEGVKPFCLACGQATVDTSYNGFDYCDPCREHECLDLDDDGGQPHVHGKASDA